MSLRTYLNYLQLQKHPEKKTKNQNPASQFWEYK